jgi:hypothetical protein
MPDDPFDMSDYKGPEFMVEQVFDEERGVHIWIELVCTCGLPVAKRGYEPYFYCLHCDEACDEKPHECRYCQYAMMDRAEEE